MNLPPLLILHGATASLQKRTKIEPTSSATQILSGMTRKITSFPLSYLANENAFAIIKEQQ
ncbi:hypothetical protein [Akkermansia glycaniphila]|uniref:hypothetical protein n=1 Tax=Akkermansia glycaniphila TaxID=1679444 RepID=UPI001147328A|nr:hypothetical protein [Akkermansia glycaniphila]